MRALPRHTAATPTHNTLWPSPPTSCCCHAGGNAGGSARARRRIQCAAAAPADAHRTVVVAVAAAAAAALLQIACPRATLAHIAIDQLPQPQQQQGQDGLGVPPPPAPSLAAGFNPSAVGQLRGSQGSAAANRRREARRQQQAVSATRALEALGQLRAAEELFRQGDYAGALQGYTLLVQQHPDLALTEYARLGQALCMYQEGQASAALTQLNELELDLRGNPETHAALAAVLYAERPAQRWRAEQQWDIAVDFDRRYEDVSWVASQRKWPPRLVGALERFLSLE